MRVDLQESGDKTVPIYFLRALGTYGLQFPLQEDFPAIIEKESPYLGDEESRLLVSVPKGSEPQDLMNAIYGAIEDIDIDFVMKSFSLKLLCRLAMDFPDVNPYLDIAFRKRLRWMVKNIRSLIMYLKSEEDVMGVEGWLMMLREAKSREVKSALSGELDEVCLILNGFSHPAKIIRQVADLVSVKDPMEEC